MGIISGVFSEDDTNPILALIRTLDFLDMKTGPWVGGGALRRIFSNEPMRASDIDVFLPSSCSVQDEESDLLSTETAAASLRFRIKDTLRSMPGFETRHASGRASEMFCFETMKINLISRRQYGSAEELINDFDYTICMAATDGREWIADDRLFDDLRRKRLVVGVDSPRLNTLRLSKYCSYGFTPTPGVVSKLLRLNGCDEMVIVDEKGVVDDTLLY